MTTIDADLTPLEQLAFPFIQAAVRIDSAKQNPADREALVAVLDSTVAMWMFYKNYLGQNFSAVPEETKQMLVQLTDFTTKAAVFLRDNPDEGLLDRLIQLNLNMSEQILRTK
ncbi:MAG TPA: flagellar biosynthesis regulator FlaF [Alphaproteobacteria bacterium]|nr:flagellar biosynthesis regulator FlaF [Alphaproteobacteria bacterium]